MTTILQLLVFAMAISLSVAEAPPYKQYVQALREAAGTLVKNVLSMKGHIPLLNDTRRHYIEIVHVVNYFAEKNYRHPIGPYLPVYYQLLNTSAPEAINHPEKVISAVKYLLDKVHYCIEKVKYLIDACNDTPAVCNELIQDTINENEGQYGYRALILRKAGEAANEFNERNRKFEEVSNALKAHQYVCTSPGELANLVKSIIVLYQIIPWDLE